MKTPWHLWVVGALSLLWNGGGAFDYVATQFGMEAYLSQMTAEQRAYLDGFPVWATAAWAVGVWGAVLGSLGLLLRRRWATAMFALSLAGIAVNGLWGFVLSEPSAQSLMGPGQMWFSLGIVAVTLALMLYARMMDRRGVLT